ncbi:hypothetical protein KZ483_16960 [Paenibacillus sp. sptzw28]|uniref:hypothetical protein n=1 Tax=Paenibacillus sp. sptzw28 TaxID=715179 RepID=UPI001C6E790E|nr:hypothetical protein [Paenibacillus sp. sptzw28]QYR19588.1 hypothetical protein KZ483_16960 [Paenibacillus sp. sptzw28]
MAAVPIAADFPEESTYNRNEKKPLQSTAGAIFLYKCRHDGQIAIHTIREELPAFEAADQGFAARKT